jgi:glucoamylase
MRIGTFVGDGHSRSPGLVPIKNRPDLAMTIDAGLLVSPDALALVRFGLRAADDPRIVSTVRAIDALLKRDLPAGPYWYRYNEDGYGETEDGGPFNGAGVGRLWPLLTGERAHFEIAAGRLKEARRLLGALEASSSPGGMIPEQIWDQADLPQKELYLGKPSGSAMPLVWAHAEHIKLLRSLKDGSVFDMPPQTLQRYVKGKPPEAPVIWKTNSQFRTIVHGRVLRFEFAEPAVVRWSPDGWSTHVDMDTTDTELGTHICDIGTDRLTTGDRIEAAVFWPERNFWAGDNFEIDVVAAT